MTRDVNLNALNISPGSKRKKSFSNFHARMENAEPSFLPVFSTLLLSLLEDSVNMISCN